MKRSRTSALACSGAALALLAGCGGNTESYMPMRPGSEWTYQVHTGFETRIESVRVSRRTPVEGLDGWLLVSKMGSSKLVWKGQTLMADELAGTRFIPALPILSLSTQPSAGDWQGLTTYAGKTISATSSLQQASVKFTLGPKTVKAIRTAVRIAGPNGPVELWSWFVEDIGLVRQEQRDQTGLVRSLEYVKGP